MGFEIGESANGKMNRDSNKELKYVDDWTLERE